VIRWNYLCRPLPDLCVMESSRMPLAEAGILKNYCVTNSGWPEVLSLAHIVQILNRFAWPELFSMSMCNLKWWPTNEGELASDQYHSAICVVIHRREWDCIERRFQRSAYRWQDLRLNMWQKMSPLYSTKSGSLLSYTLHSNINLCRLLRKCAKFKAAFREMEQVYCILFR
jgi:hypothetical protein